MTSRLEQVKDLWVQNDNEWEEMLDSQRRELAAALGDEGLSWNAAIERVEYLVRYWDSGQTENGRLVDDVNASWAREQELEKELRRLRNEGLVASLDRKIANQAMEIARLLGREAELKHEVNGLKDAYGDLSSEYAASEEALGTKLRLTEGALEIVTVSRDDAEAKLHRIQAVVRSSSPTKLHTINDILNESYPS